MPLATMTAGIANITMKAVTSIAQTKSGIRLSDMPGARSLNTVVMRMIASSSADSSVKVTSWAQKSARLPAEYSGPAKGTYENQPASGPMFSTKAA